MKKALVKIEKNTKKISYTGLKYLYHLLKNKEEIFKALIDEDANRIYIDVSKYKEKLNYVNLRILDYKTGCVYWESLLKDTKEKIPRYYTFNIIEDKQLELEF